MNVIPDMFLKVQNIDIVKEICGGDQVILYPIVQKKVEVIQFDIFIYLFR
jgi:hypothetical protein